MKTFGNTEWYQGSNKNVNVNSDGSSSIADLFRKGFEPGSLFVIPYARMNKSGADDTWITVTNSHPSSAAYIRLYWSSGFRTKYGPGSDLIDNMFTIPANSSGTTYCRTDPGSGIQINPIVGSGIVVGNGIAFTELVDESDAVKHNYLSVSVQITDTSVGGFPVTYTVPTLKCFNNPASPGTLLMNGAEYEYLPKSIEFKDIYSDSLVCISHVRGDLRQDYTPGSEILGAVDIVLRNEDGKVLSFKETSLDHGILGTLGAMFTQSTEVASLVAGGKKCFLLVKSSSSNTGYLYSSALFGFCCNVSKPTMQPSMIKEVVDSPTTILWDPSGLPPE